MSLPGRRPLVTVALLALALPLAACGYDDTAGPSGTDSSAGGGTTITVLAAASLTGTFTDLADRFEADHPGTQVRLAFDSSASLAQQALEGAPADVLATADTATMDSAADALAADPQVFASNTMVLATPKDNPAGIATFADLDRGGVDYVACVDTAPCGRVAAALIADNGLRTEPASLEVDVKAVLAKVTSDEADAGFVYRTDAVAAAGDVTSVEIPHAQDEPTTYPIATLQQSEESDLAGRFVDLVLSDQGQQVLADAGFGKP
jgi:molybdate transport system substrate-binding protein